MNDAIERIYRTSRVSVRDCLADAFLAAETAYLRHLPSLRSGTISLEPLVSAEPGPPVYLTKRLTPQQRAAYSTDLQRVRAQFKKLERDVGEKTRIPLILRCIENVQKDLRA